MLWTLIVTQHYFVQESIILDDWSQVDSELEKKVYGSILGYLFWLSLFILQECMTIYFLLNINIKSIM